jgi:ABC-type antimicrobial peptide transport system permease subunit
MRLRELTLHKVNGATNMQIALMLYTDFLLIILSSLLIGFMLMKCILPTFKEYASIGSNDISIYYEILFYSSLLIASGLVFGGIPVFYFRKRALRDGIKGNNNSGSRNLFHKYCLLIQLIISLSLMFCSIVVIKQIYYLNHTDLGINRRNIASVSTLCCPITPLYAERIRQIPGIIDALPITDISFLNDMSPHSGTTNYEKDGKKISYTYFILFAHTRFFDFFGVEIIKGTGFSSKQNNKNVVNETAMHKLGDELAKDSKISGVSRDFYLTPNIKSQPVYIYNLDIKDDMFSAIAYKYEENHRQKTQLAITRWLREEFQEEKELVIKFNYMEDIFSEYFKSERALLLLLSIMTSTCILIAVFGIYSLTALSCQQRRKEIAIRKISGADVLDIMNIFFKEYLLLLFISAIIAFPTGYLVMKSWLLNYVKQTSIDAWVFIMIFLFVFVIIIFSIFSMVLRTAKQNPAMVVKAE